jgi:hypothetical protein
VPTLRRHTAPAHCCRKSAPLTSRASASLRRHALVIVEAGAGGEPRLLSVEPSLHATQHDVINLSRVAKADNGKALVGQQRGTQPLVGLTFRTTVAILGVVVDRVGKVM